MAWDEGTNGRAADTLIAILTAHLNGMDDEATAIVGELFRDMSDAGATMGLAVMLLTTEAKAHPNGPEVWLAARRAALDEMVRDA